MIVAIKKEVKIMELQKNIILIRKKLDKLIKIAYIKTGDTKLWRELSEADVHLSIAQFEENVRRQK